MPEDDLSRKLTAMIATVRSAGLQQQNGVYYLQRPSLFAEKEQTGAGYGERRPLLDDNVVRRLPLVPAGHPDADDWIMRADAAARLLSYLETVDKPVHALDWGCGNGWLTHMISRLAGCTVVGIDTDLPRLEQAARVFGENEDLAWLYGYLPVEGMPSPRCTHIVLAWRLLHCRQPRKVLQNLLQLVPEEGEIHIIDHPWIMMEGSGTDPEDALRLADQDKRLATHRQEVQKALADLEPQVLYRPDTLMVNLRRRFFGQQLSAYVWISIKARH